MTVDVTYIEPDPDPLPVTDVLDGASICDEVIVIGRLGDSLLVTQSRSNIMETMATLDVVRAVLADVLINESGTWH